MATRYRYQPLPPQGEGFTEKDEVKNGVEVVECDDCGTVKPESDFRHPGHTAGGQIGGFDVDSCVCADCARKNYEDFQADLYEAALAELANEEMAGVAAGTE